MTVVTTPVPRTWANETLITDDLINAETRDIINFLVGTNQTTVKRAANQSIASGGNGYDINWDTEYEDVDELISVPGTTFTFTRQGVMHARAYCYYETNLNGSQRTLRMAYKPSGGAFSDVAGVSDGDPIGQPYLNLTSKIPVGVGDQLKFISYQDSGATLGLQGAATLRWCGAVDDWNDVDAPPPPPAPGHSGNGSQTPGKHVVTYYPTWSRTYDWNQNTALNDTPYCYQGYWDDATGGNLRSLVGFNYSTIKSDLVGATNISAKFTFFCQYSYLGTGVYAYIGAANVSSKLANISGISQCYRACGMHVGRQSWATIQLPSDIAYGFQSGAWKAMTFGPGLLGASRDYFASFGGATQAGRPYLTFTYYI